MKQYLELQRKVLSMGIQKGDRTGTGTLSLFGETLEFDLRDGFPVLTTKQVNLHNVINELLWFLSGSVKPGELVKSGTNIWNKDSYRWYKKKRADAIESFGKNAIGAELTYEQFVEALLKGLDFDLGPIYGAQWRNFGYVDQISKLIHILKDNPDDRRMIVSAWNPAELHNMALPPCHIMFQCYTQEIPEEDMAEIIEQYKFKIPRNLSKEEFEKRLPKRYIDLQMYQRSCDLFLGVPYNISSYSFLLSMLAQQVNMVPRFFKWIGGDVHIYNNHIDACKLQLDREPLKLPQLIINPNVKSIFDYQPSDFMIVDYQSHKAIRASLSVG